MTEAGGPVLPGYVNAPPPPLAAPPAPPPEAAPAPSAASASAPPITGTVWAWQRSTSNNVTTVTPANPERYTIEFMPGSRMNLRAECNRGQSEYSLDGGRVVLSPIALTKILCPPGTKDREFLADLAEVKGYELSNGELVLLLRNEGATMRFRPRAPIATQ